MQLMKINEYSSGGYTLTKEKSKKDSIEKHDRKIANCIEEMHLTEKNISTFKIFNSLSKSQISMKFLEIFLEFSTPKSLIVQPGL